MDATKFSDIEETVSFYTRNDFAIINSLLLDNMDDFWKFAQIAYEDNRGILHEYATKVRTIDSEYDRKWIQILEKRTMDVLDDATKEKILRFAKTDILNILAAMKATENHQLLYRTAWTNQECKDNIYPYARRMNIACEIGSMIRIPMISSTSKRPYRENETPDETDDLYIENDFYRYEITVPKGFRILELNQYECHNEEDEILLPAMKCKVTHMRDAANRKCKKIIELLCLEELPIHLT